MTIEQIKLYAVKQEERLVSVPLTETEKEITKDEHIQDSLKMRALKKELAEMSAGYKVQIKEVAEKVEENLMKIHTGAVESTQLCHLVPDLDGGVMEYYTDQAIKVFSRPLRPDEKQENIFKMPASN